MRHRAFIDKTDVMLGSGWAAAEENLPAAVVRLLRRDILAHRTARSRAKGLQKYKGRPPPVLLLDGVLGSLRRLARSPAQGDGVTSSPRTSQRVRSRSPGSKRIWNSVVFVLVANYQLCAHVSCVHMGPCTAQESRLLCSVCRRRAGSEQPHEASFTMILDSFWKANDTRFCD